MNSSAYDTDKYYTQNFTKLLDSCSCEVLKNTEYKTRQTYLYEFAGNARNVDGTLQIPFRRIGSTLGTVIIDKDGHIVDVIFNDGAVNGHNRVYNPNVAEKVKSLYGTQIYDGFKQWP